VSNCKSCHASVRFIPLTGVELRGAVGTVLCVTMRATRRAAYIIEVKNVTGPGVKARGLESLAIGSFGLKAASSRTMCWNREGSNHSQPMTKDVDSSTSPSSSPASVMNTWCQRIRGAGASLWRRAWIAGAGVGLDLLFVISAHIYRF
jgi:hypothetical protein